MNIRQLIIILCLGLFLLPISLRGQASQNITTEQGAKTAQFMKGSGDFESIHKDRYAN